MEPIDLVLKIFGIREVHRAYVETLLKTTKPEYLGLALFNYGQHAEDQHYDPTIDEWMEKYLPEIQFQ